jgi:hypothetical protein
MQFVTIAMRGRSPETTTLPLPGTVVVDEFDPPQAGIAKTKTNKMPYRV